jgi:putative ATPase
MILFGPAGVGKSCIAEVVANMTKSKFLKLNATTLSVVDIRKFAKVEGKKLLFIDELYRASRSQSDVLLPFVEDGTFQMVGSSTESPFHTISSPLVSRSVIFQLEPLSVKDLLSLLVRGINHLRLTRPNLEIEKEAALYVARVCCGDGRKCLTLLDLVSSVQEKDQITLADVQNVSPNKYMVFDEGMHFDIASAEQGSLQASDPDSAIYWLAKWLESQEDVRYIARRIMVSAAEDAYSNPICTAVAHAAYTAAKEIGRPECDILLAQAVCLIATSKRDKSAACAIWSALKDVREGEEVWVPKEMKDSHYKACEKLGQGAYHDGMNMKAYVGVSKRYYRPEDWA